MRSPLFLSLLLLVPVLATFGQPAQNTGRFGTANLALSGNTTTQSSSEELGQAIRTILEHHVLSPAPQELGSYAARVLKPSISPTELRAVWKLQSAEDIATFLNDLEAKHPQPSRAFAFSRMYSENLTSLANKLPDTQLVMGGPNLATLGRTYVGLGIRLGYQNRFPMVMNPEPSGPAFAAGLRDRDLIVQINGDSMQGQFGESVIKRLRDKHGTEVTLRIRRFDRTAGKDMEKDMTITRDVINFQRPATATISAEGIGWREISFSEINDSTFEELREMERELEHEPIKTIHLDLSEVRYCSPRNAILLADLLTPTPGEELGRAVTVKGERQLQSTGNAVFSDKSIVLKIGYSSASALTWVRDVTPTRKSNVLRQPETTWLATEVVPVGETAFALRLPTTQFFAPDSKKWTHTTREVADLHAEYQRERKVAPDNARPVSEPLRNAIASIEKRLEQQLAQKEQTIPGGTETERTDAEVREYTYDDLKQIMELPLKERMAFYAEHIDETGKIRTKSAPLKKEQP